MMNTVNISSVDDELDPSWEYSSALFLCMTILTTIGYGNFSPKTVGGKVFCIVYGLIGIPICGVLLASTSDYFSNGFLRLYERSQHLQNKSHGILIASLFFLLPGLALFIFIPSFVFIELEEWSYLDAIYFSFVTLTTIGFGDIVAAQQKNSSLLWFYRISLIIWVTLGIAYWAIIIAFITKALKSKKLKEQWLKTSQAISQQALEMRRVLEHQLSTHSLNPGGRDGDAFVALKSKATFEFALHLAGSISKMSADVERRPLPGVATAFRPNSTGRDLFSLMELSATILGRHSSINRTISAENQLNTSSAPCDNRVDRPWLANVNSSSTDSGFDDEITQAKITDVASKSREEISNHKKRISKPGSRSSTFSSSQQADVLDEEREQSFFAPMPARPELISSEKTDYPQLENLIMEAMLILQEAEVENTRFNTVDESRPQLSSI